MSENKCPNGVNPEFYAKCVAEDREKKATALHGLCTALWKAEDLYEVESESDHPLEKAYELIYNFIESEGLLDDLF
jgi:hypothetical protein